MTIVTAIVLIVAVGALVQGNGDGESLLGASKKFTAIDDSYIIPAGRVQLLDVLSNDKNPDRIDPADIVIIDAPACGNTRPLVGKIEFAGKADCSGTLAFTYCVSTEEECKPAVVTLDIRNLWQTSKAPLVAEATIQPPKEQVAEAEVLAAPQIALQPQQLSTPTIDDITTPEQAVASIRNIPHPTNDVEVVTNLDAIQSISTESAFAVPVDLAAMEMAPPTIGAQDSDIKVASTSAAPQASSTPIALPDSSTVEVAHAPDAQLQSPTQTSVAVPEDSGILASIAKSNTLIGATFSVAKSLLEPKNSANGVVEAQETSAPGQAQSTIIDSAALVSQIDTGSTGPLPRIEQTFVATERPVIEAALSAEIDIASIDTTTAEPLLALATAVTKAPEPTAPTAPKAAATAIQMVPNGDGNSPLMFMQPTDKPVREEIKTASVDPKPVAPATAETPRTLNHAVPFSSLPASGDCDADFDLEAMPGAEVAITVSSPCRAGQTIKVSHESLEFNAVLDASGNAEITFPVFTTQADVAITFDDGASVAGVVEVPDLFRFNRVAIIWDSPVDLNLHANEYGATSGDAGHVWSGNPVDYRTARRVGGGYLTTLGEDNMLAGPKVEIYSIPMSARTEDGLIELSVEIADQGEFCNEQMTIRSLRTENANLSLDSNVEFSVGECGADTNLIVKDIVQDLRIARN